MNIEIHGAGFANKGAQLMLETVIDRLRSDDPTHQLFITAGRDRQPADVGGRGLQYIWPSACLYGRSGKFGPLFHVTNFLSRFISRRMLSPYGLARRKDIDALIDISGYAFGDKWGATPTRKMAILAKYYARRNCPVIMLPQMLGPFGNPEIRKHFKNLADATTLIFARDRVSLDAAREIAPSANLTLAPDITIGSKVEPSNLEQDKTVCFVPNQRMLDSGEKKWTAEAYLGFFGTCHEHAKAAGFEVSILVHDTTGEDLKLAQKLAGRLGIPESAIIRQDDPKRLKSTLAKMRFVVGSRYHSLVASLSSNVPVLVAGWAHKYEELLSDYQQSDCYIVGPETLGELPSKLESLIDENSNRERRSTLQVQNDALQSQNEVMWDKVFDALRSAKN